MGLLAFVLWQLRDRVRPGRAVRALPRRRGRGALPGRVPAPQRGRRARADRRAAGGLTLFVDRRDLDRGRRAPPRLAAAAARRGRRGGRPAPRALRGERRSAAARVPAGHDRRLLDRRPAAIDQASRTNWACDQASGVAENVPVPAGEAGGTGRWAPSHTCSGSMQPSFAVGGHRRQPGGRRAGRRPARTRRARRRRSATSGRCVTDGVGREADVPRSTVALLAVAVAGVAVPELAGRAWSTPSCASTTGSVLRTSGSSAALDAEPHQLEEARVDDGALVDAVGPLSPIVVRGGGGRACRPWSAAGSTARARAARSSSAVHACRRARQRVGGPR